MDLSASAAERLICAPRLIADNDGPGADLPSCHQSIDDVRIFSDKIFDDRLVRREEHEKSPIRRIVEGSCEQELAPAIGLAREPEMLIPKSRHEGNVVVYYVVDQSVIVHDVTCVKLSGYINVSRGVCTSVFILL